MGLFSFRFPTFFPTLSSVFFSFCTTLQQTWYRKG
jgi:hypothetical protein